MYWTCDSKGKEYRECVFKWKCDNAVINKCEASLRVISHQSPCHTLLIGTDPSPDGEPLCCGFLPSHVFIFNWSVITFTRLHRSALWKTPDRETASPSATPSSLPTSLLQDRGPHSACWPWWLEDPSHPLFCLFCNKMECFSLLLQ